MVLFSTTTPKYLFARYKYYDNDLWIACDGGIFYSNNQGDTIHQRMFGISGTDFWGFGAGFTNGEIMLGGTYHNGTLIKDNEVYECQEYQTIDKNVETLDMNLICKELVQPYERGIGT